MTHDMFHLDLRPRFADEIGVVHRAAWRILKRYDLDPGASCLNPLNDSGIPKHQLWWLGEPLEYVGRILRWNSFVWLNIQHVH